MKKKLIGPIVILVLIALSIVVSSKVLAQQDYGEYQYQFRYMKGCANAQLRFFKDNPKDKRKPNVQSMPQQLPTILYSQCNYLYGIEGWRNFKKGNLPHRAGCKDAFKFWLKDPNADELISKYCKKYRKRRR